MLIDDVLELTLRDYVLDLEDKIKVGHLGSLKVANRETWRNAINNRKYDKQCDKLVYGVNETPVDFPVNSALDKIKTESKSSRPGTPDSEVDSTTIKAYRDPGKYLGPPDKSETAPNSTQQNSIKQMACAILQVYHATEHKYLKKPLGIEEARDKWEQSLMASTSWSQLFVHLNTLENSITWSRSASNACCRICRKRRDAENMLLCDGCNKGHHLYCLKPKLTVSKSLKILFTVIKLAFSCSTLLNRANFRLYRKVIGSVTCASRERANQRKKRRKEENSKTKWKRKRHSLERRGIIVRRKLLRAMKMRRLEKISIKTKTVKMNC